MTSPRVSVVVGNPKAASRTASVALEVAAFVARVVGADRHSVELIDLAQRAALRGHVSAPGRSNRMRLTNLPR
jgi:hypothetical protein